MGKANDVIGMLGNAAFSRRSFLKAMAAVGASSAIAGCSKDDNDSIFSGGG